MKQRQNLGLRLLSDVAKINDDIAVYHLGFVLGPRINAGGRVGLSRLGADLLSTEDEFVAYQIATRLDILNDERRQIQDTVYKEAFEKIDTRDPFLFAFDGGWHPGVIGIVAGRLKDKFRKPIAIGAMDENGLIKGSCRSVPGFDIGACIHKALHQGLLLNGGGHSMAAGFTLDQDKVCRFKEFLNHEAFLALSENSKSHELSIDGVLSLKALTMDLLTLIEQIGPFGAGNPTPKFAFADLKIIKCDVMAQHHLRLFCKDLYGHSIEAVIFRAFDMGIGEQIINHQHQNLHIVGTPKIDEWQGQKRIKIMVEDVAFAQE